MLAGWLNPLTGQRHALDDYDGMAKVMPAPLLRLIARTEQEDEAHSGTNITITSGIGCPRRLAIERFLPTWQNPQLRWPATMGTGWHSIMAREMGHDEGWVTEHNGGKELCKVTVELFGVRMTGRMDARHHNAATHVDKIWDYKFSTSGADQWVDGGKAKPEHSAQVNMLRLGMIQGGMAMAPDLEMTVWVAGKTWVPTYVRPMDELTIGLTPLYGSRFTVREAFEEVVGGFAAIEAALASDEGEPGVKEVIKSLPLRGLDMMRNERKGTSMCNYCSVAKECEALAGKPLEQIRLERTGKVVAMDEVRARKVVEL